MIYTVTLNPALDYVLRLDSLKGNINRAKSRELYCGGKGINVSVILKRLGVDSKALGFIAGFTGDELEKRLKEEEIDCAFTRLENGYTRINVKIRTSAELDINADGPEISLDKMNELIGQLDTIKDGDFLVLSGSIPKNAPKNAYELILDSLGNKKVNTVIDAEGELLKSTLKYKPFLIKPNHHELGELFEREMKDEAEIISCAERLQKLGARNVLVSRAENGALLITESGNALKSENAKGTLINSVGCGDSMLAGFIAGYIKSKSPVEALKLGTACGNATAFTYALAKKDEIDKILNNL